MARAALSPRLFWVGAQALVLILSHGACSGGDKEEVTDVHDTAVEGEGEGEAEGQLIISLQIDTSDPYYESVRELLRDDLQIDVGLQDDESSICEDPESGGASVLNLTVDFGYEGSHTVTADRYCVILDGYYEYDDDRSLYCEDYISSVTVPPDGEARADLHANCDSNEAIRGGM